MRGKEITYQVGSDVYMYVRGVAYGKGSSGADLSEFFFWLVGWECC